MRCPHCKGSFRPSDSQLRDDGVEFVGLYELGNWRLAILGTGVLLLALLGGIAYYNVRKYDSPQYQSEARRRWTAELEGLRQYLHEVDERLAR